MFFKKLPKINNIKMRKMVGQMEMENSTKCIFTACFIEGLQWESMGYRENVRAF